MLVKSVVYRAADRRTCIADDQPHGQQVIQSQRDEAADCDICIACSQECSQHITQGGGKRLVTVAHALQAVNSAVSRAHIW